MITHPTRSIAVPLVMLAIAMAGSYTGFTTFARDLAFTSAQTELSFWGRDGYQPQAATIVRAGQSIGVLVQTAPNNPQYLGLQAAYGAWRAYWAENMDERASFNRQSVLSQYQGLQSRPAHRHSWLTLIEYAPDTTTGDAMLIEAQAQLQALSVARASPL